MAALPLVAYVSCDTGSISSLSSMNRDPGDVAATRTPTLVRDIDRSVHGPYFLVEIRRGMTVLFVRNEVDELTRTGLFDRIDGLCNRQPSIGSVPVGLEIGNPRVVVFSPRDRLAVCIFVSHLFSVTSRSGSTAIAPSAL